MGATGLESVDIVIPVFNAVNRLLKCVAAIQKNTVHPCRIILIDDCSTDRRVHNCLRKIEDPDGALPTRVILCESNLGFARVNNLAVNEHTTSRLVCLLNEDTEVFRGWLSAMVKAMDSSSEIGIVGAKLIFPQDKPLPLKGKIQHLGVARGADGAPFHPYRGQQVTIPMAQARHEINAVTGACMLIRRTTWEQVGGFDPAYIRGQFEDVDFCWSARKHGWKILIEPRAVAFHYEHGSGDEHVYGHHDHNRAVLMSRWRGLPSDVHLFKEPR